MEIMLPILRADFALYETYLYSTEPPLNCPISAFGGLQDRRVNDSDLEAWRAQTSASFSLRMFPGDHFFLKHASSASSRSPRNCNQAGENGHMKIVPITSTAPPWRFPPATIILGSNEVHVWRATLDESPVADR